MKLYIIIIKGNETELRNCLKVEGAPVPDKPTVSVDVTKQHVNQGNGNKYWQELFFFSQFLPALLSV